MYANFVPFLSSPSSWESFMRTDETKSRAQIHLQLGARALLFDKACVSLFPRSNRSSPSSNSKLNQSQFCTGMMFITLWRILHKMWHNHLRLYVKMLMCLLIGCSVFLKNGASFRLNITSQRQPFSDVGFLISRILINGVLILVATNPRTVVHRKLLYELIVIGNFSCHSVCLGLLNFLELILFHHSLLESQWSILNAQTEQLIF
ncbi:hypothetical protein Hanom_Chr01g00041241 [Helianthus anomalus]